MTMKNKRLTNSILILNQNVLRTSSSIKDFGALQNLENSRLELSKLDKFNYQQILPSLTGKIKTDGYIVQ